MPIGQVVRLGVVVRTDTGADVNAGTITLTLTRPDGTTEVLPVLNPPTVVGHYRVDYVPTMAGPFLFRWAATAPATVQEGSFYVTSPGAVGLLSLAEAKSLLRIPATETKYDEDVEEASRAATEMAELASGRIMIRRTVVETFNLGATWRTALALTSTPVVRPVLVERFALSGNPSVVETVAPPDVWTDDHGILRCSRPAVLTGVVRVTYLAGPATVTSSDRLAVGYGLQRQWSNRHGASGRPRVGGSDDGGQQGVNDDGTGIPDRMRELLGPRPPLVG